MFDIDASLEAQSCIDAAAIERHLRFIFAAAIASLKSAQVEASGSRLTLHFLNPAESKACHFHLNEDGLVGAIREAKARAESGFNVYAKLVVNRFGLRRSQLGTRNDWRAVFAFGVDLDSYKYDRRDVESLPLHPSLLIQTSMIPEPSAQAFYFLSKGIQPVDAHHAEAIAWGLAQIINDRDGGTANILQSWRICGTLNYPTARKIAAGRPPHPQGVQLLPGGTEKLYTPEQLAEAIETELALDQPLADAYRAAAANSATGGTSPRARSADGKDRWDGDPRLLQRDLDALASVSSDTEYATWKKVIGAWASRYSGTDFGKEVAHLWCVGGTYKGFVFEGAPDRFVEADFNKLWDAAVRKKLGYKIASLYWFAHKYGGWDMSLARWGLSYVKPEPQPLELPHEAQAVLAAAEAFPKDRPQLAVDAWFYQATLMDVGGDLLRVLSDVRVLIHKQSGFAIVEPSHFMRIRKWAPTPREIQKREPSLKARRHLNVAERLQLIARSPGSSIGAHRKRGQTIALTLPNGITWDDAINTFKTTHRQPITQPQEASSGTLESHYMVGHNGSASIIAAPLQSDGGEQTTPQNNASAPLQNDGSSYTVELQTGGVPAGDASRIEVDPANEVLRIFPLFAHLPLDLLEVISRAKGERTYANSLHCLIIEVTRERKASAAQVAVIVQEALDAYCFGLTKKGMHLSTQAPSRILERIHDDLILKLEESGIHRSKLYGSVFNKRQRSLERWKQKQLEATTPPARSDGKPDLRIVSSSDEDLT